MAKPNYSFEKRQKELEKARKKEEKLKKKQQKNAPELSGETEIASAETAPDEGVAE